MNKKAEGSGLIFSLMEQDVVAVSQHIDDLVCAKALHEGSVEDAIFDRPKSLLSRARHARVGDRVVALHEISRVDGRGRLHAGQIARVTAVDDIGGKTWFRLSWDPIDPRRDGSCGFAIDIPADAVRLVEVGARGDE